MKVQSMSAYDYYYISQSRTTNTTAVKNGISKPSNHHRYDILDLSEIQGNKETTSAQNDAAATKNKVNKRTSVYNQLKLQLQQAASLRGTTKYSEIGFDSSFLKSSPNDFINQASKVYASYLNPDMYADDGYAFTYQGDDFEGAFDEFVGDISQKYARQLAGFFSSDGNVTQDQVDQLAGQFAQVIREYGTQLASGKDDGIDKLKSKLKINGAEMTVGELNATVKQINQINPTRVRFDTQADFAVAGLGVAKMMAFANKSLSKAAADMVMKTYNDKLSQEIERHDRLMAQARKVESKLAKSRAEAENMSGASPKTDNTSKNESVEPYYRTTAQFKGSAKEDIFKFFANIDVKTADSIVKDFSKAVEGFNKIMKDWEGKRGYALSSDEKKSNELKISAAFQGLVDLLPKVNDEAQES